jgi:hypothetical protein
MGFDKISELLIKVEKYIIENKYNSQAYRVGIRILEKLIKARPIKMGRLFLTIF